MIPQQLFNSEFRLIKIEAKNKKPIESGWTQTANYLADDPKIHDWIKGGGNYGIACGFGNLIVIDCDNQELHELVKSNLPPTFQVRTGGGGYHHYYILPNQKKIIFEKDGIHLGELQAQGQQVVGANSTHPNGEKYIVINDIPISILDNGIINEKLPKNIFKGQNKAFEIIQHAPSENNLRIEDVVPLSGLRRKGNGEYQGPHPIHSKPGEDDDFTVNPSKNVWHCFWHNCGGDPLYWIAIQEGIIQCGDKLDRGNFLRTLQLARDKYGLKDEQTTPHTAQPHADNLRLLTDILAAKADDDPAKATELMVGHLETINHIYTIKDDTINEMWIYEDGIYRPNGITTLREQIRDIMGEQYTTNYVTKVLDKIQADTYVDQDKFFSINYLDEIAVQNGLLNLVTYELNPFDPKKIFFSKIPVTFDPSKQCPGVIQFFEQILKNVEDLPVIQEIFGYLIWKEYFIERAIMLTGNGRNGKGKTLELMKRFVGIDNISSIPLQQMDEDMYSISELQNKLANLAGDLDSKALKHSGRFKELTGRDNITAARKFKTRITFTNYAKLIFAANDIPQTNDIKDAFFMRWVILEFPFKFLKQEEYDAVTDAVELAYTKVRDPNVIDKISTPEELSGLLNWALIGLQRLKDKKDFSYNKSIKEVQEIWIKKSDSFTAYCMDTLIEEFEHEVSKGEIRQTYNAYCKRHKLRPCSDQHIQKVLTTNFGVFDRRSTTDESRERVWVGVNYKPLPENRTLT
jgi:P4 family phage/plasmid primase-like protien